MLCSVGSMAHVGAVCFLTVLMNQVGSSRAEREPTARLLQDLLGTDRHSRASLDGWKPQFQELWIHKKLMAFILIKILGVVAFYEEKLNTELYHEKLKGMRNKGKTHFIFSAWQANFMSVWWNGNFSFLKWVLVHEVLGDSAAVFPIILLEIQNSAPCHWNPKAFWSWALCSIHCGFQRWCPVAQGTPSTRGSSRALSGSERGKSCNTPGWQEESFPNKCNTQRPNQGMKDWISRGALQ